MPGLAPASLNGLNHHAMEALPRYGILMSETKQIKAFMTTTSWPTEASAKGKKGLSPSVSVSPGFPQDLERLELWRRGGFDIGNLYEWHWRDTGPAADSTHDIGGAFLRGVSLAHTRPEKESERIQQIAVTLESAKKILVMH